MTGTAVDARARLRDLLRSHREHAGMTQVEVARALRLPSATENAYGRHEREVADGYIPSDVRLRAIANALGLSADDLDELIGVARQARAQRTAEAAAAGRRVRRGRGRPPREELPEWAVMLRNAREAAGLTQDGVSAAAGASRAAYSRVEAPSRHHNPPRPEHLQKWARAIGMGPAATRSLLAAADRARRPAAPRVARRAPAAEAQRPPWSALLQQYRLARGLTATAAARRMGVSAPTYTGLETGTRPRRGGRVAVRFTEQTVDRIAAALELTPDEHRDLDAAAWKAWDKDVAPWQEALRAARRSAALTVEQAAAAAGVSRSTYRNWEASTTGAGADRAALSRFLDHPGVPARLRQRTLALAPAADKEPEAPTQPTAPVEELPEWSKMITSARLRAGMYQADADRAVGTPGVVRRFELGGWPREDGRLSVPTRDWLDRVAEAVRMTPDQAARLHAAADRQRVANAASSDRPLTAALLEEARRAAGMSMPQACEATGIGQDYRYAERGSPEATLALADPQAVRSVAEALSAGPVLSPVLIAAFLAAGDLRQSSVRTPLPATVPAVDIPSGRRNPRRS